MNVYDSTTNPERYVRENREKLVRVLRHGSDEFARACAWTLLDEYCDDVAFEQIEEELRRIKAGEAVA
ncbi:hypothetical protein [Halomarina rubra]|uniref:Uncharacterized protein n=1 Tax=Halomarina rubra TaxID=2071873 RepID=A0ABD6ASK5_9EURY|nr:hypothetical protein [Halomarina rubra]